MSINTILLTKTNELNQTMNNNAFVSYGKVLTCKDGIIEIVGLRDVMAGEVVKLGNDQMGMISNLEKTV
jgi:F0F1-type ATP synthase alpha subunit